MSARSLASVALLSALVGALIPAVAVAAAQDPSLVIVQISDPQAITPGDFARFQLVLDTVVAAGQPGALLPRAPHVVLLPGDFVDDDRVLEQWTQTRDMLDASLTAHGIPYFAVPGNHDQERAGIARYEEFIADSGVWDFGTEWFTGHNGRSAAPGWRGLRFIGVNTSNGAWNTVSAADAAEVDARVVAAATAGENVVIVGHHEHNGEGRVPLLTSLSRPEVIGYVRGHANQPFVAAGLVGVPNPNVHELNSNSILDVGALLYHEVFADRIESYVLRLAFGPTTLPAPLTIPLPRPLTPAVPAAPSASFEASVTAGDAPLTVAFTDLSTGPATSWAWDFGDGATSTLQSPVHTYTAPGVYTVRLEASNVSGASTLERAALITVAAPPPIRVFPAVADAYVKSSSPTRNYGAEPELRVRAGDVVYRSYVKFSVTGLPAAPLVSARLRLHVTDGSDVGGALHVVPTTWTEGALTYANAPTPAGTPVATLGAVSASTTVELDVLPVLAGNGTYAFALQSTSTNSALFASRESGLAPELVLEIGPAVAPVADFSATPVSGLEPLTVRFTDTSANFPTSFEWDFGDGATSTTRDPVHTYTDPGTYSVVLRASNEAGTGERVATDLVTVLPAVVPTASFSAAPLTGNAPLAVTFTDTSAGNPTSWSWDFGDGALGSGPTPVHTYTTPGTFDVTLLVSTGAGSDYVTRQALIVVAPPLVTSTFPAVADARVRSSNPTSNYGASDYLQVRAGDPVHASYVRFAVAGLAGHAVQRARLRFLVLDGSGDAGAVYRTTAPWSEATLTYANRPALSGGPVGALGSVTAGNWVELDVTSVVQGNGMYDFALADGSTNSAQFSSREGLAAPQLVVDSVMVGTLAVVPIAADAYVKSTNPTTNYGSEAELRVRGGGSPRFASYLRFDVVGTGTSTIESAVLRLFVTDGSRDGGRLYLTPTSWSEGALTHANAPPLGRVVRVLGATSLGTWLEVDVTPWVTGDGPVSFGIDSLNTDSAIYSSREGVAPPELVLILR